MKKPTLTSGKSDINNVNELSIESPCIRNCCLDQNDYCLGCRRHLTEITGWRDFSVEQKKAVLAECLKRNERAKS